MKKLLAVVLTIAMMTVMTTGMCFAATTNSSTVPVNLDAPAIGEYVDPDGEPGSGDEYIVGLSFTVTEKIDMTATVGTTELEITDLTVTNNAPVGQLKVDSLEVTAAEGWALAAKDTEFELQKSDSKVFSFVLAEDGFDFSTGVKSFGETKLVAPNDGTQTFEFEGEIGTFMTEVETQVASVVATISVY